MAVLEWTKHPQSSQKYTKFKMCKVCFDIQHTTDCFVKLKAEFKNNSYCKSLDRSVAQHSYAIDAGGCEFDAL